MLCRNGIVINNHNVKRVRDFLRPVMGIADKKGSLVPGMDADVVIFDKNINIKNTIIRGRIVY